MIGNTKRKLLCQEDFGLSINQLCYKRVAELLQKIALWKQWIIL